MSQETWIKEFYPIRAADCPKGQAVEHSLRKWQGLTPKMLKAHGLNSPPIPINGGSCALCTNYLEPEESCENCPLYQHLGHACDGLDANTTPPWKIWHDSTETNPFPMIKALERTLEKQNDSDK